MKVRILQAIGAVAVLLATAVAVFVWDEARKEVVFLCGNFESGVTRESVLRQLDTGHFLRYVVMSQPDSGTRITVDSAYHFGFYVCDIELDENQVVIRARTNR